MSCSGRVTRRAQLLLGIVSLLFLAAPEAEAARARELGLGDMAGRAGRIFLGRCTAREVGEDPRTGIPTTTYTFVVTEPIKGVARGPTTFRVPGTPEQPLIPGLASFEVHEEALLLLYPESPAGYSTAMGLDQGRFRMQRRPDGSVRAVNGRANQRLLADVPSAILQDRGLEQGHRGALGLTDLLEILRAMTAERHQ